MASRRTVTIQDNQRNSAARKRSHRETRERAQQQAELLRKLIAQARAEEKAKA